MAINSKSKKEVEELNRIIYGSKSLKELKEIGKKEKGLLNVDHYKKADRKELIERLVKGRQLKDESKSVLVEQGRNEGVKVNASMSKKVILEKITNPKLTDLNVKRLRKLAAKNGVSLKAQITEKGIIQRLENPTEWQTIKSLKIVADNNKIEYKENIKLEELRNILAEKNLITTTPIKAQDSNLWVEVKNIPESLRRVAKKKARNAREAVEHFKEYIKNLKKDYITPARLKKLTQQLEKKEKKAKEEIKRIFTSVEERSALKNFTNQYKIKGVPGYDAKTFLYESGPAFINIMSRNRNIKAKLYLYCHMKKIVLGEYPLLKSFAFHSIGQKIITEETDPREIYEEMIDEIEAAIQKTEHAEGSGWIFDRVDSLILYTVKWIPLKGSSYIDLPKELKSKNAIVNMKNKDNNKCFLWCILRELNPKDKDNERIDKDLKNKENTLNMEGITYPVELKDINKFEKQNMDISISVLGYNTDERVYPLRISEYTKSKEGRKHNIVLLLIKEGDNSHYCLVKNLSRLLTSQISNHNGKLYFCLNCFNGYDAQEKLNHHKEYCGEKESIKITMPPPETYLKFKNFVHREKAPFTIYADFESILKPIVDKENPNPNASYTNKYQKHEPVSYVYYIKSFNEDVYKSRLRRYVKNKEDDPDVADHFINRLEGDIKVLSKLGNKKMVITEEEELQFKNATHCWICGNVSNIQDRVRDHCHFTGRYRGAACNRCNLKYSKPDYISVFFHNLQGYDSHLFIKRLGVTEGTIDCIPNNEQKYISFSKSIKTGEYINKKGETKNKYFKIIFKDTLKFMVNSGMESLVNNLPEDGFKNLEKYFNIPEQAILLKRKGFFPYDYLDNLEKLKVDKPPPQKAFYSKLSGHGIIDKNYKHF